jgi:hypothetical protein
MRPASDFDRIAPNIAIWHAYNPVVKAELYSTCLATGAGTYLVDPILLQREAFDEMMGSRPVAGIVLTNSNHHRAAAQFTRQFSAPIFAHGDTFPDDQTGQLTLLTDGDEICDGLRVIGIAGGPPGEIVLHCSVDGGTLIVGDEPINFEPYGFAFLPAKILLKSKTNSPLTAKTFGSRSEANSFCAWYADSLDRQ